METQTQVIQGPWQGTQPHALPTMMLPSFPIVAAKLDSYAVRVPWWAWAIAGLYVGWRFLGGRRTVSIT
jgi:hypothetical protein